ncbi:hypothetical protein U0070_019959 [Myodes glareolus]|uniref:Uncharacterized protein n=1 Tax=Myodes glareolus TaxID=447135 RepID=A0AAW0JJJ3_MYOGA
MPFPIAIKIEKDILLPFGNDEKVIDEIYRVLRYVNSTRAPQRAHEVLQELRDISSMAMEYFDEKIFPDHLQH